MVSFKRNALTNKLHRICQKKKIIKISFEISFHVNINKNPREIIHLLHHLASPGQKADYQIEFEIEHCLMTHLNKSDEHTI